MKPEWIRIKLPSASKFGKIRETLKELELHTVCEEARCPNASECWGAGTATFMIMGDVCTRACRFCAVTHRAKGLPPNPLEPSKLAKAVENLGLDYVVITSVDRDDLPDGGASHFASCIKGIKNTHPKVIIEALIPDFSGDLKALKKVVEAGPEVIAHNIETTEKLTPKVRDARASYKQSLAVLKNIKMLNSKIYTKSSIMLGLGEEEEDVIRAMEDLRCAGVDFLTIGQYLRPSISQLEVKEYVHPSKFDYFKEKTLGLGFLHVASGPLVRSSYRASEFFIKA